MILANEILYTDIERTNNYYSVVDGILFCNNHKDVMTTAIKNKAKYTLFNNSCVTHNFRPFKYKDIWYGIGGQDNWKVDRKWRGLSYTDFKKEYKNHFGKKYNRGESFYEEIKYKFDTTQVFPHNRGLYLLTSMDGINWKFILNEPIVTVNSSGFNSALSWKSAEFDAMPEVIRFKDKWFLYLRNNIDRDRRDIQFAVSDNLMEWSEFRPIDHNYNIDIDNYYHPVMFEHKKKLFGFFNYYNNDMSCIRLKVSEDGKIWKDMNDFFVEKPHIISERRIEKNGDLKEITKVKASSVICSVLKTDNNIFLWVNHFYSNNNIFHNSYVAKYKIPMGDFNAIL